MKSPAMLLLREDPIPNQYINILTTKKYQSLPLHLKTFLPGFKSLINYAHDPNIIEYDRNDFTNTSLNDKEYSVKNPKVTNKKYIDDKYNYENSQDLNSNEIVIIKTEEEKLFI